MLIPQQNVRAASSSFPQVRPSREEPGRTQAAQRLSEGCGRTRPEAESWPGQLGKGVFWLGGVLVGGVEGVEAWVRGARGVGAEGGWGGGAKGKPRP